MKGVDTDMFRMGFHEGLIVLLIGIIRFGIPLALAVWIIITLRQVRADAVQIKIKLEEIERRLQSTTAG